MPLRVYGAEAWARGALSLGCLKASFRREAQTRTFTQTHTHTPPSAQLLHADVGSVTMWSLPKGFGDKSMDEMFLQASGSCGGWRQASGMG